jgi:hypothetical protein
VVTTASRRRSGAQNRTAPFQAPTLALWRWPEHGEPIHMSRRGPAQRYTTTAWAHTLGGRAARHGWTARDLSQLLRDWIGVGHWMPGHTAQTGLLRAIIVWHANREERPAAQLADRTNAACAVAIPNPHRGHDSSSRLRGHLLLRCT